MQSSRQSYLTQRTQQTVMLSYLSIGATSEMTPDLTQDILLWLRNKIGLLYYRIEEAIPITGLPLFLVKIISLFIVSVRYFILLCRESE